MLYWDTSALLKLYVAEPDSSDFLDLITHSKEPICSSAVAAVEVLCALSRKEQAGDLGRGAAGALYRKFTTDCDAGRTILVPYGRDVLAEAEELAALAFSQLRPVKIRSLDLIHVASAVAVSADAIVATDRNVRRCAALARIKVLPRA